MSLRLVFAGTPSFAATLLEALYTSPHQILAVFCQPDRPQGRHKTPVACPVKMCAQAHSTPIFQPERLKKDAPERQWLMEQTVDAVIVAAYGLMIPQAILDHPKHGCINLHASLLPRWRGASPIHHALLHGDLETGVTVMQMTAHMDAGDMLHRMSMPITPELTTGTLTTQLAHLAAQALLLTLDDLNSFQARAQPQNLEEVTLAPKLCKADGATDFKEPTQRVMARLRAMDPWPGLHTFYRGQKLAIHAMHPTSISNTPPPGTLWTHDRQLLVACVDGALVLDRVQLAGKKTMDAPAFLAGHHAWLQPQETCCTTPPPTL